MFCLFSQFLFLARKHETLHIIFGVESAVTPARLPTMQKHTLRKHIKTKLQRLSAADVASQSNAIFENLFASGLIDTEQVSAQDPDGVVCSYLSMSKEVQTDQITQHLFAQGCRICVPRVLGEGREMRMLLVNSWSEVEQFPKNQWGIPEPPMPSMREIGNNASATDGSAATKFVNLEHIKAVIVPGLAFDSRCARMGRGKGYYDTFFESMRRERLAAGISPVLPLLIGLSFTEQLIDDVPTEVHDVLLNAVVTPSGVIYSSSLTGGSNKSASDGGDCCRGGIDD